MRHSSDSFDIDYHGASRGAHSNYRDEAASVVRLPRVLGK